MEWGYFPIEAENDVGGGCVDGGCDYDINAKRIAERKYHVEQRAGNNPVFFTEPTRKSACQQHATTIDGCGCLGGCLGKCSNKKEKTYTLGPMSLMVSSKGWLLLVLLLLIGLILYR